MTLDGTRKPAEDHYVAPANQPRHAAAARIGSRNREDRDCATGPRPGHRSLRSSANRRNLRTAGISAMPPPRRSRARRPVAAAGCNPRRGHRRRHHRRLHRVFPRPQRRAGRAVRKGRDRRRAVQPQLGLVPQDGPRPAGDAAGDRSAAAMAGDEQPDRRGNRLPPQRHRLSVPHRGRDAASARPGWSRSASRSSSTRGC